MEVKELRIGNILDKSLKSGQGRKQLAEIGCQDIVRIFENTGSFNYEPIPLTEEWMLKFGFVKRGIYYHFPMNDIFKLEQYKNKNAYWLRHGAESIDCVRINHVHSLQNIFHCLVGEELKLADK